MSMFLIWLVMKLIPRNFAFEIFKSVPCAVLLLFLILFPLFFIYLFMLLSVLPGLS